jgi:hypothetical protein
VDNLIENIAYKSTDGNVINENFDPTLLESKFRQAMSILQVKKVNLMCSSNHWSFFQDYQVQTEQNIKHLEESCEKERNTWANSVAQLEDLYQVAFSINQTLPLDFSIVFESLHILVKKN